MTRSRVDSIARVAQRLAVLLAAGIPPAAAWGYLDDDELPELISPVAAAAAAGDDIAVSLGELPAHGSDLSALRGLAAAWRVATRVGAPSP